MSQSELDELLEAEAIEPQKEEKKGLYPTIIDLVAIFGIYALTQLAGVWISKFVVMRNFSGLDSETELAWVLLLTQIISMTLLILFLSILRSQRKAPKPRLKLSTKGFDARLLLGGFSMMISTAIVIEPLLMLLPPVPPIEARGWPLLVAVVIAAPLFEEIICRGFLFESMRSKWGVAIAWFGSSLFFALMHIEPAMVVNAFFMGLILCYFAIRSEGIIAPIILHSMNNALAYIFILLGWGNNVYLRDLISNQTIYLVLYIVAVVILIGATLLCARKFKAITAQNSEEEEQSLQ